MTINESLHTLSTFGYEWRDNKLYNQIEQVFVSLELPDEQSVIVFVMGLICGSNRHEH